MALASGATFAGYVIARRLGSGSTGDVYLAQDHRAACWRALKVLSPAMSTDAEFGRRFRAETPTAAGLRHPHLVEVHERGEFYGSLYVAMEYVEGISAAHLIADRFPAVAPAGEVLAIATAVAEALDHVHRRGLLHRDVRPANILLTGRGEGEQRILLSDVGVPRGRAGPETESGTDPPEGYAAPERLTAAGIDGRADQYALAATAFHLLTGAPPGEHPPRLSEQRPELAHLDAVFARALAGRPEDRFDTCGEFAAAANERAGVPVVRDFEAVLAEYPAYGGPAFYDRGGSPAAGGVHAARKPRPAAPPPPAAGTGEPPAAVPRRRRPRRLVLAVAALALIVGLVALGVVVGRTGATRAARPAPAPSAVLPPPPAAAPAAPAALDGAYRLEVRRTKQTFNDVPDPQPPDVTTWWAYRSSCAATGCVAVATQLDDRDHRRAAPGGGELVMRFGNGRWQSQPEDVQVACAGSGGATQTQATTMVLSLRPGPGGALDGDETVTVHSNECGQRSAVVRIPAMLSRRGDVPPAVTLPDPATVTDAPATTAVGPHR